MLVVIALGAAALWWLLRPSAPLYRIEASLDADGIAVRVPPSAASCPASGRGDAVASLGPSALAPATDPADLVVAPGQIVPFRFVIEAAPAAPEGAEVSFAASWPRQGNQRGLGFASEPGVLCTFVVGQSGSAAEGSASAHWRADAGSPAGDLRGRISVESIGPGERIVVESWLVAPAEIAPSGPTLRTAATRAESPGRVDLDVAEVRYRLSSFARDAEPDLTLVFEDHQPEPRLAQLVEYEAVVRNEGAAPSPAARLDITLDPETVAESSEVDDGRGAPTSCGVDGAVVSCDLGYVGAGEQVVVTVRARVAAEPSRRWQWTTEEGDCTGELFDICATARLRWSRGPDDVPTTVLEQPTDLPSQDPLSITKLVPVGPFAYDGLPVEFSYRVSNGSVDESYSRLELSDSVCAPIEARSSDANGTLDPGESWEYACRLAEISADNAASESRVSALDREGRPVTVQVFTEVLLIRPRLTVSVAPSLEDADAQLIRVAGSGDAPLDEVVVAAPACATLELADRGDGDETLDPGEQWVWRCTTAGSAAPVSATAYGSDQLRNPVVARSG